MRFDHRAVPIVLAAVLIDTIGFGIVLPVLPALLMRLGHTDIEHATRIAGYMLVVFAGMQFLSGPVLGNLSDRFGRRPVLVYSMLSFAADYALMAWAPTVAWLFLGRAIAGAAGAVYGPAGSVIADVTPPEKRAGAFALIGAAFGLGFIVGPALGGIVAQWGERAPFIVAALLALANAAVMIVAMPETLKPENRRPFSLGDAHIVGAFRPLFHAGIAGPLLLAAFLFQLAHMVYPATWGFWATARFGWGPREIGWSLAFVGMMMVIVQAGLTGRAVKAFGERSALLIGMSGVMVALFGYAFITAGWQAYALFVVGSLQGFVMPSIQGLLSRMVDATRQGQLQGGMGSMGSVSAILGPLILTQALAFGIDRGFPGAAFLLAGLLTLLAALIVVWKVLGHVPPKAADEDAPAPVA